jgi:hypothetical protein
MLNKIMAPTFDNVEARLIEVDFKKSTAKVWI